MLPISIVELNVGRRFGPLVDPDLICYRGEGWFAGVGVRFTEIDAGNIAGFWRSRLAR